MSCAPGFEVLDSKPTRANKAFQLCGVGELEPHLYAMHGTLTYPLAYFCVELGFETVLALLICLFKIRLLQNLKSPDIHMLGP